MHNRVQSCVATLAYSPRGAVLYGGEGKNGFLFPLYRCGANMVCRLPCSPSLPSTLASPLGMGRGAAGSYSNGVLRPTRFAVALMRSSWVMSWVGLYRSTNSCEALKDANEAVDRQQAVTHAYRRQEWSNPSPCGSSSTGERRPCSRHLARTGSRPPNPLRLSARSRTASADAAEGSVTVPSADGSTGEERPPPPR